MHLDFRAHAAVSRALFNGPRPGAFGALRDLHGLTTLAAETHSANTVLSQAAQGLRDAQMMAACGGIEENIRRQLAWLNTQVLHRASHTVVVPT